MSWSKIGLCFIVRLFVHLNSSVLSPKESSIWQSGQEYSLGVRHARETIPTSPLIRHVPWSGCLISLNLSFLITKENSSCYRN